MPRMVIGTRGSALARAQTEAVARMLTRFQPDLDIEIRVIVTQGDRTQSEGAPLASFGEKGIFVKELEAALVRGEIDAAVHSTKDLASAMPEPLCIAAVPVREDVRDVVVGQRLALLPPGSRIGTGSVRRRALLAEMYPRLSASEIRGNVDTRVRKLREGAYDAIILAAAGLKRLDRGSEIAEYLDPDAFVPDPGQGALAIQARSDDTARLAVLSLLSDRDTAAAVTSERAYLAALGGGCQTPAGAWATVDGGALTLRVMAVEQGVVRRATLSGDASRAREIGADAAARITAANFPPACGRG